MKSKENNLEKNISRLVKLAGDSDKPSTAFADSLTEQALDEIEQTGASSKQEQRDKSLKINWLKPLAYAAAILIVCGLAIALVMPTLNVTKRIPPEHASTSAEHRLKMQARLDSDETFKETKAVAKDEGSKPAKIEYTKTPIGKPMTTGKAAKPPVSQTEKVVAKLADKKPVATYGLAGERREKEVTKREIDHFVASAPQKSAELLGLKPVPACAVPAEPRPCGYPMAHGGTRPPNAEAYDAMFFKNYGVNPFIDTEDDHLSTFATDVDTGSYTIVRKYLHDGHLPPEKAVRVEEFVNYFKYDYAAPQEDDFAVYPEAAPWKFGTGRKNSYLLRLGLKAKQVSEENRKPAILTFVIDVSGSMNRENRLGLVKRSLRMLIEQLRPEDKIGIAVYGSRGRKVMDYKGLDEKNDIISTIDTLHASGSTYAEEGIRIGYEMAESAYRQGHINRVILCSDGVANVGQTGADEILEVIKKKAEKGITLSAIGFGMGNYNDVLLERLGDKGNGHYAYIDNIAEARRIFEGNLTGTLQIIARDVKVQVDFNPQVVRSYRLIGYENRDVPDEKFRDDKYDGGEVGAGHSVTALYELKLWPDKTGTAATTFVRYKDADTRAVTEFKSPITVKDFNESFDDSSSDFRLAGTAAEFAEILRKSYWAKGAKLSDTLHNAQVLLNERPDDPDIIELVDLISKAKQLMEKEDTKSLESEEEVDTSQEP
jgi:Ca-activated chloride channel family protein